MPKNLRDILFGPEAYLPNEDVAALHRARYNEDYLKYQPGYYDDTYSGNQPFLFRSAPVVAQSYSGKISQYNEQTSDIIHTILIQKIRSNLINKIQSNLYRDTALRRMLGHVTGAARPIEIKVEVEDYPRVNVTLTGPFWLRFFYYGRRAFTIHGDPSNTKAHGKLVFYDPETLDKMVVSEVHMPAIPAGRYVENAVIDIKDQLLRDPHFLDEYLGDSPDIGSIQDFTANMNRQLDRIRTQQGLKITALLQELDAGTLTVDRVRTLRRGYENLEEEALNNFRSAVNQYVAKGMPETRETKKEVYNALRAYLDNVKTHLVTYSNIQTMLPTNLAQRSTVRKIVGQYR